MFNYITLGTNDLDRARAFYTPVMATLGFVPADIDDSEIGFAESPGGPCRFWVNRPYDGKAATVGNGSMPAFAAKTRAEVDAFHAAGLASGGTDEGAPGLRPYGPHFYACYLRDPDGNKLSAVCEIPQ
jgi:catechol 2,3-dioxygenase-like lactoylglutathione lyase family enzyme